MVNQSGYAAVVSLLAVSCTSGQGGPDEPTPELLPIVRWTGPLVAEGAVDSSFDVSLVVERPGGGFIEPSEYDLTVNVPQCDSCVVGLTSGTAGEWAVTIRSTEPGRYELDAQAKVNDANQAVPSSVKRGQWVYIAPTLVESLLPLVHHLDLIVGERRPAGIIALDGSVMSEDSGWPVHAPITLTSTDPSVATTDGINIVAKGVGVATIGATSGGVSTEVTVAVVSGRLSAPAEGWHSLLPDNAPELRPIESMVGGVTSNGDGWPIIPLLAGNRTVLARWTGSGFGYELLEGLQGTRATHVVYDERQNLWVTLTDGVHAWAANRFGENPWLLRPLPARPVPFRTGSAQTSLGSAFAIGAQQNIPGVVVYTRSEIGDFGADVTYRKIDISPDDISVNINNVQTQTLLRTREPRSVGVDGIVPEFLEANADLWMHGRPYAGSSLVEDFQTGASVATDVRGAFYFGEQLGFAANGRLYHFEVDAPDASRATVTRDRTFHDDLTTQAADAYGDEWTFTSLHVAYGNALGMVTRDWNGAAAGYYVRHIPASRSQGPGLRLDSAPRGAPIVVRKELRVVDLGDELLLAGWGGERRPTDGGRLFGGNDSLYSATASGLSEFDLLSFELSLIGPLAGCEMCTLAGHAAAGGGHVVASVRDPAGHRAAWTIFQKVDEVWTLHNFVLPTPTDNATPVIWHYGPGFVVFPYGFVALWQETSAGRARVRAQYIAFDGTMRSDTTFALPDGAESWPRNASRNNAGQILLPMKHDDALNVLLLDMETGAHQTILVGPFTDVPTAILRDQNRNVMATIEPWLSRGPSARAMLRESDDGGQTWLPPSVIYPAGGDGQTFAIPSAVEFGGIARWRDEMVVLLRNTEYLAAPDAGEGVSGDWYLVELP